MKEITFLFTQAMVEKIISGLMLGNTPCLPIIDAIRAECQKQLQDKKEAGSSDVEKSDD